MRDSGLYVDLKPWQCHFFKLSLVQVKPEKNDISHLQPALVK